MKIYLIQVMIVFMMKKNFLSKYSLSELQKIRENIFPRLLNNYNHFWNGFTEYVVDDFYTKIGNMS